MTPTVSKEHWHSKLIKCLNICDMVLRPLYGFVNNSIGKNLWPAAFHRFERRNVQEFQRQFITWSLISLWDFSPYPADPSLTVARHCCFKLLTLKCKIGLIWCYSSHVALSREIRCEQKMNPVWKCFLESARRFEAESLGIGRRRRELRDWPFFKNFDL